ncbi:MAG: Holliday junction resolvase RuvX [Candidatus Falkowbacteria bacterium]
MTYLGIDWGEKRIGLALADGETRMALPFTTVANFSELLEVIADEEVDEIVIGHPLKMKDSNMEVNKQFSAFMDLLKKNTTVPLMLIDERLSSKAADALEGNKGEKHGRDEVAAMLILQDYLDKIA